MCYNHIVILQETLRFESETSAANAVPHPAVRPQPRVIAPPVSRAGRLPGSIGPIGQSP